MCKSELCTCQWWCQTMMIHDHLEWETATRTVVVCSFCGVRVILDIVPLCEWQMTWQLKCSFHILCRLFFLLTFSKKQWLRKDNKTWGRKKKMERAQGAWMWLSTLFVCVYVCKTGVGGGCCMRVLATHVTPGGMIIHQDYTLINLKH